MQTKMKLVLTVSSLSLFTLMACTQASNPTESDTVDTAALSQAEFNQKLVSEAKQINELAKNHQACNVTSDCDVVPVGARACGGPDWYLIMSKNGSGAEQLRQKVDQYTNQKHLFNQKFNVRSICVMQPKPEASCIQQKCTISNQQADEL
ncbi:MAG: hypothetical protein HWE27_11685 [Gammaproteobacteria bacterium]|nr:hypothetical protein [Gammaproteobacteria bacterium]